ncbi:SDR family NAD(P)-dependent oxidoreductase [Chroococcidiopsis sp. TS-821]|uniref:SDR family NAD(P)-dependent oxidoreductase n=1 Tax=Chroococcidiopsis sp. TS-821 TaxID=1378066 RepID=UPI001AEF61E4|nr:SDR family NAD(P)-dependent oxidoreductase [Chroococcidiopsis sp. TS-821]
MELTRKLERTQFYIQSAASAQALAKEIGDDRCYLVQTELAVLNASQTLWQKAIAWRGQIDVLVNNAGIIQAACIDDELHL